jgi:hypothetical protein
VLHGQRLGRRISSALHRREPFHLNEVMMHKSACPGLLAWLAAIAVHAGVVWLVAPPL